MTPRATTLLAAALATAALTTGCSSNDETATATSDTEETELSLAVASFDLAVGDDRRFLAGLFTPDRQMVVGGDVSIRFFDLGNGDDTAQATPIGDTVQATFLPVPGKAPEQPLDTPTVAAPAEAAGVYETTVDLDQPGLHGVVVKTQLADGTVAQASANFEVLAAPEVPDVGDPAPAVDNATTSSDDIELVAIDSRAQGDNPEIPDPALHDTTVADALTDTTRPLVVAVTTPTYCVSQFCGPITDTVADLANDYADRADFVHLEVWQDFEDAQLNDAAAAWIQTAEGGSEPWVFYVEPDGTIGARWDNVLDQDELVALLDATDQQDAP